MIHRVYVAGPYTAASPQQTAFNVHRAARFAAAVMARGHLAHCPHAATHEPSIIDKDISYEQWMKLDLSILKWWATGMLFIGSSPGADRELEFAKAYGLPVWFAVESIPLPDSKDPLDP